MSAQKATPKDGIHTAIDSFARVPESSRHPRNSGHPSTEAKYFDIRLYRLKPA
ncbi:hypothetical protein RA11412_2582 [Rothia aeria]|uniref:Uncharacterized protein n=1 Tax=Rothia aeria TaxID=172042 RepID=A0A2Z5R333_9MICC|nr:hypothetical protein RA11412_2582 [Rothia aeria]